MAKSTVQTLITIAALASMNLIAVANDDSGPAGQLPSQATSSDEKSTEHEIIPHASLFNDDGWQSGSCGGSSEQSCLEGCGSCTGTPCGDGSKKRKITADIELMALRTHFSEDVLGKLAERYQLSERITVGVERPTGIGGRIRYWTYDRTTPTLNGNDSLRTNFDVVDFEGTTRLGTQNFDLLLTGGIRWADIVIDIDAGRCRNDMPGGSFGFDLRGIMCRDCENGLIWRSVSGARFSIFGGDWELSHGLVGPMRDDNLTVVEIYGGVECTGYCRGHEVYARLVFETQNWRSDALGETTGIDSIGFIGPGLNLGINY